MQGDAPFMAWRSGRLTQLFYSQNFPKMRKDGEALPNFVGGAHLKRKNVSVFSSLLIDSTHRLSSLLLQTSMATSCINAIFAEHTILFAK